MERADVQSPTFTRYEEANKYLKDDEMLACELSENGYLFFRNLMERSRVENARDDIVRILRRSGFVAKDSVSEPKWSGKPKGSELDPDGDVSRRIGNLRSVRELTVAGEMVGVLRRILGGEAFSWLDNKNRVRIILPGSDKLNVGGAKISSVTPVHQDYYHFRLKDSDVPFYTVWVPLMDIDESVGGLALRKDSHKEGFHKHWYRDGEYLGIAQDTQEARKWLESGAVAVAGGADPGDDHKVWLRSDYRVGDVLMFHRLMIHRGLLNNSDKIRISGDFRYQRKGTPTVWPSKHSVYYLVKFNREVRECLRNLGVQGERAERIREIIRVEGPSRKKNNDIFARVKRLLEVETIGTV